MNVRQSLLELAGLGLFMGIASNWNLMGRPGHFALMQGLVLATGVGATLIPRARAPLGLLALLAIGALFAYFDQTYQTGSDPWHLFALWSALALLVGMADAALQPIAPQQPECSIDAAQSVAGVQT